MKWRIVKKNGNDEIEKMKKEEACAEYSHCFNQKNWKRNLIWFRLILLNSIHVTKSKLLSSAQWLFTWFDLLKKAKISFMQKYMLYIFAYILRLLEMFLLHCHLVVVPQLSSWPWLCLFSFFTRAWLRYSNYETVEEAKSCWVWFIPPIGIFWKLNDASNAGSLNNFKFYW